MKIMQLTMGLPAPKVLVTRCIQESVMTKPHHERFTVAVKDITASIQYITLLELQFSKLYLLYFVFCQHYKSKLHPKIFTTLAYVA